MPDPDPSTTTRQEALRDALKARRSPQPDREFSTLVGSSQGRPDLDDTTRCPVAAACFDCRATYGLAVVTVQTVVGVYCITLCPADRVRPVGGTSAAEAVRRALDHCAHLGITVDQMSAQLEEETAAARRCCAGLGPYHTSECLGMG